MDIGKEGRAALQMRQHEKRQRSSSITVLALKSCYCPSVCESQSVFSYLDVGYSSGVESVFSYLDVGYSSGVGTTWARLMQRGVLGSKNELFWGGSRGVPFKKI